MGGNLPPSHCILSLYATLTNHISMSFLPNFSLTSNGRLSNLLMSRNISTFGKAIDYLATLSYSASSNPQDLTLLISQGCGTFTARNAFLVQLAHEQGVTELALTLCVQKFDEEAYPEIKQVLADHGLEGLPDMNGCLKYQGRLFSLSESSLLIRCEVLSDVEIAPVQIGTFKRRYHQKYLENWLQMEGLNRKWSVEQVWRVHQECLRTIEVHGRSRRPVATLVNTIPTCVSFKQ